MFNFSKKTKILKDDLFSFKNEPLTSLSIFFLIILDLFIFTNISIGIDAETSKSPRPYTYYPSSCSSHFLKSKESYQTFASNKHFINKANSSELCKELYTYTDKVTQTKEFQANKTKEKSLKQQLSKNTKSLNELSKKYNTQLFEKIASVQEDATLYKVQNKYRRLELENKNIQKQLDAIKPLKEIKGYREYKSFIEKNKEVFKTKREDYKFWQPFYEYGHLLVFVLPLLIISALIYANTKKKELHDKHYNPVVKIISVHVALLLSLPLIFYTLNLVYHVIPKTLLKNIIDFLIDIGLISLLNYFGIFIAIFIFGYIIYFIQKRSIKNKSLSIDKNKQTNISLSKCPKCLKRVDFSKPYCPHCSNELLIECTECHKQTIKDLNYCQQCGSDLKHEGDDNV